jgi:hypothetical protein
VLQNAVQEERDLIFRVDLARKLVKEFAASEEGQLHYQQVILPHVSPIFVYFWYVTETSLL